MKDSARKEIEDLIVSYPELNTIKSKILLATDLMIESFKNNGKLLVCGNGGSASDSLHIVGELMKSFKLQRPIDKNIQEKIREKYPDDQEYLINNLEGSFDAKSLVSEISLITAFSNDKTADLCFAQQVYGYGNEGDVLLVLSTSGNSKNAIYAAKVALAMGMSVISLTGNNGGKIKEFSTVDINVPQDETYKVQEYHLPIYHAICLAIECEFYG